MTNTKAMFFDLDGTLLHHGALTDSAKEALQIAKEKGILLFVATGRNKREIEKMPWYPSVKFDGFVTMNGTYSYIGDEVIYKKTMDKDTIRMVVEHITTNPLPCAFSEAEEMFMTVMDENIKAFQEAHGLPSPPLRDPEYALSTEIYQLSSYGEEMKNFICTLPNCTMTSWAPNCYDIVPKGANKWVGMQAILERFNLKPSEIAAFGDGNNDLEMLSGAGFAVAMGNGSDEVKALADYITADVDKDGVLKAVKHILNNK